MAGDITLALRTIQSGLLTSQAALSTVANNIANVNSPNYSRKIAAVQSRVVGAVGAGVEISDIIRRVNENLLRSLRQESSTFENYNSQQEVYDRLQDLFGTPEDNTSLSHMMQNFATSAETLAVSPNRSIEQNNMVRWGLHLSNALKDMTTAIQELRLQADIQIGQNTTRINELIVKIGDLNDSLVANSTIGSDTSDLKDLRDEAVDELATIVDIRYFTRTDGDVVVYTADGRVLVDRIGAALVHDVASTSSEVMTHAGGDFDGIYVGAKIAGNDLTNAVTGGKLKGLIESRDKILPKLQAELDQFAAKLRDTLNQIHNRGAAFPGTQSLTGTRTFVEPATQTVQLDPTGSVDDVTIALFDSSGNQSVVTTLNTIMTSVTANLGAQASRGPWTVNNLATKVQDWLQANGAATATVAVTNGKLALNLNTTSLNLVFRDQTATANGSTHQDAEIAFDKDGNGTSDETVYGFANFFGLNDFFVDGLADNIHDSDMITGTFSSGAATLVFRDSAGALTGSPLAITAGSSLEDIATQINNGVTNLSAAVVPDGSGSRLRIWHDNGSSFTIAQTAGTLLGTLGMHVSDIRGAGALSVRSDIVLTPSLLSRGAMQWDSTLGPAGKYQMSPGDDTVALQMAQTLAANAAFKAAGNMGAITTSFSGFAAQIVAGNSDRAAGNKSDARQSETLHTSLKTKSDNIRGVNLDEEMSTLLLYQQSYSAAARVVSVIQRMFDALDSIAGR